MSYDKRHIMVELVDGVVVKAYSSDEDTEVVVIDHTALAKHPELDTNKLAPFIAHAMEDLGMTQVPVSDLEAAQFQQ